MKNRPARLGFACWGTFASALLFVATVRASTHASLDLENTTYFSNLVQPSAPTSLSTFTGRLQTHASGSRLEGGINIGAMVFAGPIDPLPNIVETFGALSDGGTHGKFYLGRKKFSWSTLDEEWKLGVWQPRFRWDYLNPELQGLTGFFYHWQSDQFQIVAFASPYFIPEQGPPIKNENGHLISNNPWSPSPQSEFPVGKNQMAQISYSLDVPPTQKIIGHPGASLMAQIGGEHGAWSKIAYAYKPMNQLLLAASLNGGFAGREPRQEASALGGDPASAFATVVIHPRVLYHHVAEASFGYRGENWQESFAILSEQPVQDVIPDTWISQQITPRLIISPTVSWNIPRSGPEDTVLKASYLRSWGGDAPDGGEFAFPDYSLFDTRDPFRNAVSLTFQAPIWWHASRIFRVNTETLYEIGDQGFLLSCELEYQPESRWAINVGADLLEYMGTGQGNQNQNFFSRYQGNNRIHGGVRYVF